MCTETVATGFNEHHQNGLLGNCRPQATGKHTQLQYILLSLRKETFQISTITLCIVPVMYVYTQKKCAKLPLRWRRPLSYDPFTMNVINDYNIEKCTKHVVLFHSYTQQITLGGE